MIPLLLSIALSWAHSGDESHHHHDDAEHDHTHARRRVGDLAVESALARMGLRAEQAVQVSTRWIPGIPAPERSRNEGRAAGWAYGDDRAWVTERQFVDGSATTSELRDTWKDPTLCTSLPPDGDAPLSLTPLHPPIRHRGEGEQTEQDQRLDLTVATRERDRLVFIDLKPGESATTVEIVPREGARPSRRARATRRLSLRAHDVDLDVHETTTARQVCVDVHAEPAEVQVFVQRDDLREKVRAIMDRESDKREDGVAAEEIVLVSGAQD